MAVPRWLEGAFAQLELASEESRKEKGGVVVVYTGGRGRSARGFVIKEIEL